MKYAQVIDVRTNKETRELGLLFDPTELNILCDALRQWKAKHKWKQNKQLDPVWLKANHLTAPAWFFVDCKVAIAIHDAIKEYCTAHSKSKHAAALDKSFDNVPYCYM